MRMAFNKLFTYSVTYIAEIKAALLFFNLCVKNNLKKYITELLLKENFVLFVYSLDDLIGFLDKIFFYAFMRLTNTSTIFSRDRTGINS